MLDKLQDLFNNCWEKGTLPHDVSDAVIVSLYKGEKQGRKIRLFKLPMHRSALHCRQNLGSRLAEKAHPGDRTGKHARKPVLIQVQQRDRRHELRAEAITEEMKRTKHGSICSFRRPDQGI